MRRRLLHFLQDSFMRLFRLLSHLIPNAWIAPLGRTFGSLLYNLSLPLKKKVLDQLQDTFPEKSPEEIRRLFQGIVRNGGEVIFEQLMVNSKMILEGCRQTQGFKEVNKLLYEMSSKGRGLVVLGTHMCNWEKLMGMCAHLLKKHYGWEVSVVMNRMPTQYMDRLATVLRHRILKCNFIYTKQARYYVDRVLAQNGLVVFATDLDYRYRGLFVPFMGRRISMGRGPAYYALKNDAPLSFIIFFRDEHNIPQVLLEEIQIERTGDMETDVYRLTAELASRVEYWIRKYPDQWFGWLQQPWKTRPLEELEEQLAKEPQNAKLMEEIGLFQLAKDRKGEARKIFQKAVSVNPESARAHSELGNLLIGEGEVEEGLLHLFHALELQPGNVKTRKYLGRFFLERKLYRTSLRYFRSAARVKYDDPEAYWGAGQCLEKLGKARSAVSAYQKGLRIDFDYAPLHEAMAEILTVQPGKKKEREKHLQALEMLSVRPGQDSVERTAESLRPAG